MPADDATTRSWATSEAVRRSMRGNRSRDTIPELRIRSALHALGLRFRVHARPVPTIARHPKIDANRLRDRDTDERLRAAGWTPLRIWEHVPVPDAVDRIRARVAGRRVDAGGAIRPSRRR